LKRAETDFRDRRKSSSGASLDDATRFWRSAPPPAKATVGIVVGIMAFLAIVGLVVQPLGLIIFGLLAVISSLAGFIGFICLVIHAFSKALA
jgi:hypothetical protein